MTLWEWFGIAIVAAVLGSYLMMLVAIVADIVRDHDVGGVGKAAWLLGWCCSRSWAHWCI